VVKLFKRNFILRIKEQEACLILHEHDDDDDDDDDDKDDDVCLTHFIFKKSQSMSMLL
jgi:hypothetical protein